MTPRRMRDAAAGDATDARWQRVKEVGDDRTALPLALLDQYSCLADGPVPCPGPAGQRVSRSNADWRREFQEPLPDLCEEREKAREAGKEMADT